MRIKYKSGFTLIELLITIGIFVFMTAIMLARYNTFDSGTLLTNLAYDVALTVREAQTYGISVKAADSGSFNAAYGVNFDKAAPSQFVLFSDGALAPDGIYSGNGNNGDLQVSLYTLKRGAKVSALCVGTQASDCATNPPVSKLNITFLRPYPDAIICSDSCVTKYPYAEVTVSSSDGSSSHKVIVNQVGQISVN